MKIVIQRVKTASVEIDCQTVATIGYGLMILVGVDIEDTEKDAEYLAAKTASLRVMNDDDGVMNLSVQDIDGDLLAVSQFTLLASTRKGNRPSYIRAAKKPLSVNLFDLYVKELERLTGKKVQTGVFGADMQVSLVNDGPVTIIMDSKNNG